MEITKPPSAMNELDYARHLDKHKIPLDHKDIPTLASPIEGKTREESDEAAPSEPKVLSLNLATSILDFTGQRFGEPVGETSG